MSVPLFAVWVFIEVVRFLFGLVGAWLLDASIGSQGFAAADKGNAAVAVGYIGPSFKSWPGLWLRVRVADSYWVCVFKVDN